MLICRSMANQKTLREQASAIIAAAKDFVHEPETWEAYQELKTSNSTSVPPEFLALCEAVEAAFGAPKNNG